MRNYKRYGKDWRKQAAADREKVGNRCQSCKIGHGQKRYSPFLEREVTVYLQRHHIHGDPGNPHAVLFICCPRCHWKLFHGRCGKRPSWMIESLKHRKLLRQGRA